MQSELAVERLLVLSSARLREAVKARQSAPPLAPAPGPLEPLPLERRTSNSPPKQRSSLRQNPTGRSSSPNRLQAFVILRFRAWRDRMMAPSRHLGKHERDVLPYWRVFSASTTSAACPLDLAVSHTFSTFPSGPIRIVLRTIPRNDFPRKLFMRRAP